MKARSLSRTKARAFSIIFAAVFFTCAAPYVIFAQDAASAETEDLEAALFGTADEKAGDSAGEKSDVLQTTLAADSSTDNTSFDSPTAGDDVARIDYLVGGTVALQAAVTVIDAGDTLISTSDAAGKIFAKISVPDYGALYIAYNVSQFFFQGYAGDGVPPVAKDPYKPDFRLAELHYSFDIAKKVFLRLGNQLIAWGPSRVWTPVDFINLQKADSFANLDSRAGKSGLRLHVPLPGSNLFAFADFSNMTTEGTYGNPGKTVNYGGRFDFTVKNFEYGLTVYDGVNSQTHLGLDFSGRLFGTTIYGEYAFSPKDSDNKRIIQTSLGFTRPVDEAKNITASAEGFYNSLGKDQSGLTIIEFATLPGENKIPLYQGIWYAYASITAKKLFADPLSTSISGIINIEEQSYSIKLAETVSIPRAVPFSFSVTYLGGGKNKEFTRYTGDQTFTLNLSSRIEF